jgi:hypothetical protein
MDGLQLVLSKRNRIGGNKYNIWSRKLTSNNFRIKIRLFCYYFLNPLLPKEVKPSWKPKANNLFDISKILENFLPGEITPCNLRYTPELRGYLMWGYLPLFLCFRWPYIYIESYSGRILGTLWCFINSYTGWITWGYVTYKQCGCIFSSLVQKFALKAKVFVSLGLLQHTKA